MRESAVESKVCKWARSRGIIVIKLAGPANRGQPDRMFLGDGKLVFIEFKAPGKKPTPLQFHWLKKLNAAGFAATWFGDSGKAVAFLMTEFGI